MNERRKAERLPEENEVTIIVDSGDNNLSQAKIRDVFIENFTKDISKLGIGIKTNIRLPVEALIELEFTSKGLREQIRTLGQVKWVKVIIQDGSYEAGVEFRGAPGEAVKKLEDYISWKLKDGLNKKNISPGDSGDINAVETKEQIPVESTDINGLEIKDQAPIKKKPWINTAIISVCSIILIVALLKISGYIPELQGLFFPNLNEKVTENFTRDTITKKSATMPAPSIVDPVPLPAPEATTVPLAALVPATTPTPLPDSAPEATQKIKVIGNSDSKRYHLPGMKYYNAVKAYHRVEFDSETDAVRAGYNKASQ